MSEHNYLTHLQLIYLLTYLEGSHNNYRQQMIECYVLYYILEASMIHWNINGFTHRQP